VIAGHRDNYVEPGIHGATISGGGAQVLAETNNAVFSDYGTVGGGEANTAYSAYSTIGGGRWNSTNTDSATVGGGEVNYASGYGATVGGGAGNYTRGDGAAIAGGFSNSAAGSRSTVPGGMQNYAGGDYSFAAGRSAAVRDKWTVGDADGDQGTFVWADSQGQQFQSTGPNQFLIRAAGGVGIGTTSPTDPVTVNGVIRSTTGGFKFPDGTVQTTRSQGDGHSLDAADGDPVDAVYVDDFGRVGIGTHTGAQGALDVHGDIRAHAQILEHCYWAPTPFELCDGCEFPSSSWGDSGCFLDIDPYPELVIVWIRIRAFSEFHTNFHVDFRAIPIGGKADYLHYGAGLGLPDLAPLGTIVGDLLYAGQMYELSLALGPFMRQPFYIVAKVDTGGFYVTPIYADVFEIDMVKIGYGYY
jgi:hypothetical protein